MDFMIDVWFKGQGSQSQPDPEEILADEEEAKSFFKYLLMDNKRYPEGTDFALSAISLFDVIHTEGSYIPIGYGNYRKQNGMVVVKSEQGVLRGFLRGLNVPMVE